MDFGGDGEDEADLVVRGLQFELPLLTICSAAMRSARLSVMFIGIPFRWGTFLDVRRFFLRMRVVNKYSSGSSRGCGYVEKRRKSSSRAEPPVDKWDGVMPYLSTVYTDEEWMNRYPQNVNMK